MIRKLMDSIMDVCCKDAVLYEDVSGVGEKIAKKLNLFFNGVWKDAGNLFVFTDKVTQSSFTARDEKEAVIKLKNMRVRFGV